MFLEIGEIESQHCHSRFQSSFQLYRSSQPVEAMTEAFAQLRQIPDGQTASASDWLMLGNLAQVCGMTARCRAAWKMGHRAFPEDWRLAAVHAWELSAKGASADCMRVIKKAIGSNPDRKAVFHALACYNHSSNGWKKTAARFHKSAMGLAEDDAVVVYILSRAAAKRTQWQRAIRMGKRALELQPAWTRAKAACFDSYLCTGNLQAAGELLESTASDLRHVWSDFSKSTFLEISNRHDEAIEHLDTIIHYYPRHSRMIKFSCRQMVLLLMRANQIDRAREITKTFSIKGFEDWEQQLTDDKRKSYISVALIAQTTNHCVPTVAAMVARAQKFSTSAADLAEKMKTRHGTPMWKMVDTMRELGFKVRCVKPQCKIVEGMLEQNVPLVGELSGVFSGHVDVVCGFDSGLKLVHLRDPMHWYGYSIPYKTLEKRYEASCSLWAMVAPQQTASVNIDPAWINHEAEAMIDMARAIAQGKRLDAEGAYRKIGDDHSLSFVRDCLARHVVLTESQTNKRVRKEIDSISQNAELTLTQIRSMLVAIDDQNADHILALAQKNIKRLGRPWVDYVEAQGLLAKMKWQEADRKLTLISERWPAMESVWSQLGRVKTELGQSESAQRCFDIASEIAPERDYFQTQHVERQKHKIPFAQQLEQIQKVAKNFPWTPEINLSLATLLVDSDDGGAYEQALKRCIKFFPRNPWGYQQLSGWYVIQERPELAKKVLRAARKLIGEEEMPVVDFELTPEEKETRKKSAEANEDADSPVKETEKSAVDDPLVSSSPFVKHYALLSEHAASDNYQAFQGLDELAEVKQADRQHAFTWIQSAELLALEIGNLLGDQSEAMTQPDNRKSQLLDEILPEKVAGIGEQFAEYILDAINFEYAGTKVIKQILQWAGKIAPHSRQYPGLEFHRAYLIENLSQFNQSEEILNQIIRDHPAYVSAWYRLGQLHSQRNELPRAWEMFKKCRAIQPGHFGAISELLRLAPQVDPDSTKEFADAMVKRFPWSQRYIYDAAMIRVEGENVTPATEFLNQHKQRLGASKHATTTARLLADTNQHAQALEVIDLAKIAPEDEYAANWVRVDCHVQLETFSEASKWLDELEKEAPDDQAIIDQKVRLMRLDSPGKALRYAKEKIADGQAMPILAFITLTDKRDPCQYACKIVDAADSKSKDITALAYHDAINQSGDAQAILRYLEHCHKNLPHLTELSESLVYALGTNNMIDRSVKIARSLYNSDRQNPRYMSLLGWAIQDKDPKQSIKLLKKEFELTDSVETLARLGRGYQINGDDALAKKTYQKVLLRNPNHTIAMTNLMFKYGQNDKRMLACIIDTLEKRMVHSSDQYFLIQAVKLAKVHGAILPPAWIFMAVERLEQMSIEVPFADEKALLTRAIYAWSKHCKLPIPNFKPGFFDKLMATFSWPKKDWIPDAET